MSTERLDLQLKNLKRLCADLERYQKELEKDPQNENAKNGLKATKDNLENEAKGMAAAMTDFNPDGVSDEVKKFWDNFNKKVMSQWDNTVPCRNCKVLKDFSE